MDRVRRDFLVIELLPGNGPLGARDRCGIEECSHDLAPVWPVVVRAVRSFVAASPSALCV